MPNIITTTAAYNQFLESVKPAVVEQYGEDDTIALSEAWNDYSDGLCKDDELTALQYNYAPAYGDDMPGDSWDDELNHLLESMGVVVTSERVESRPDGLNDMPRHWQCTITRGDALLTTYYSQGSAWTTAPDAADVVSSLIRDMVETTSGEFESDFKDWCSDLGYDDDSRAAERVYKACLAISDDMLRLFPSKQDRDDLREVANEL